MFLQIARETILLLVNNIHEKIMQSHACVGHMRNSNFNINKTPAQGVRSVGKGEGQQQNCLGCMM